MTIGKRLLRNFRKRFAFGIVQHAINGIEKEVGYPSDWEAPLIIKPRLHKIVLSVDWATCGGYVKKLTGMFGGFYLDKCFRPGKRMPGYEKKWIKNLKSFQIIVFAYPTILKAPYLMEIYPRENVSARRYKKFLQLLRSSVGILSLSSIEYTIDLYCHDRDSVQMLFRTLRRYLHIPFQRNATLSGEKCIAWKDKARVNVVYRAGNFKMYERGPDGKRRRPHWNVEDCDRVRLEFTADRKTLRKHMISTLDDIISDAHFYEINKGIYRFKFFEGSKELPRCWESYTSTDKKGNVNCLQLEINNYRSKVKNLNQYLKDVDALEPLKSAIHSATRQFDDEWGRT